MAKFTQHGMRRMLLPLVVLSGLLLLTSGKSNAQTYPAKPVKIVVPSAPGGGTDIIGRLLAKAFTSALGQSFYVENKPGAGNLIGIEAVANAPADGYTLLFVPSPLVLNPILYKKVNYDPIKDFAPISLAATAPNIFVIHPSVKANNLRDWIALGKKMRVHSTTPVQVLAPRRTCRWNCSITWLAFKRCMSLTKAPRQQ